MVGRDGCRIGGLAYSYFAFSCLYFVSLDQVAGADPDHCPVQQIKCHSCDSLHTPECADPFRRHNQVPKNIPLVECNDYCFKWILRGPNGRPQLIRNCSSSLNIKMEKYLVCITESRSDIGMLCFCNKDKCNRAFKMSSLMPILFPLFTLRDFT
ncbi:Protein quiver [Fasciola hepatica]|uniref:UPAR/Ly6 domain-containing protein qvr n=1 Tax=Fasciola hepatica TaxID=6192 RepID=A0A4E0QY53_FASHE|nr:Protein quiver [Fasciola hepatica]